MSQENVEVVWRQVEAFNRRDVDAIVALVSPDVAWKDSVFFSEPARIYKGRAAFREWLDRVLEPWESFHARVEEITEAPGDRVFVGGCLTTRGKGSGVETQIRGWFVFWIANGKISRREIFRDRDEALEAAGLSE